MQHKKSFWFVALLITGMVTTGCSTGDSQQTRQVEQPIEQQAAVERTETVAAVHRDNRAQIRECFSDEAANGTIRTEVELHLPSSGTPASIRLLEPEQIDEPLRDCIEEVFADFEYGEGQRGTTVYQVIEFDIAEQRLAFDEPVEAHQRWGLTGDELDEVIHGEQDAVNACWELAPDAPRGRVVITLGIDSAGTVARASVKNSSFETEQIANCIVEALVDLTFTEPRGNGVVVIDYPFRFTPEKGWLMDPAPGM